MKLSIVLRLFLALGIIYGTTLPIACIWIGISLLIPFLPPHVYQKVSDFITSVILRLVLFLTETCSTTKLILHGDVERILSNKERVICFSNHQSSVDWLIFCMLAARQGSLGHVRFLLKHSLQYMPIYGFLVYLGGHIFINRKNFKEEKMASSLKYLQTKKIPSWISIYPEGTRFSVLSPETIARSQKMTKEQGLIPLRNVMFPRYRGFHMVLKNLRNHLDAVYDITIVYSNTKGDNKHPRLEAPSISEYLGSSCDSVHVHINRIGINNIPTDEEGVKSWLYNTFKQKDELLEKFYGGDNPAVINSVFGKGIEVRPSIFKNSLAFLVLLFSSLPLILTSVGRSMFMPGLLMLSVSGYIWKITDILIFQFRKFKKS